MSPRRTNGGARPKSTGGGGGGDVPSTRQIATTPPLQGGGNLSANLTLAIDAASGAARGTISAADFLKLAGIEAGADVTDAANVNAAGAIMHSDISQAEGLIRKLGAESYAAIKTNLTSTVAPTMTDDASAGYAVLSLWLDTDDDHLYACLDASIGAAFWARVGTAISASTPQLFGTASAGSSPFASAADHVHSIYQVSQRAIFMR